IALLFFISTNSIFHGKSFTNCFFFFMIKARIIIGGFEMTKHFQTIIDRTNTRSAKWDLRELLFKEKDVLPMWVADMDFQSPAAVQEAIINRAKHNIYGYNITDAALAETIANWLKKRHQWEVDTSWLSYSPGVVTSLHMIVQALTKEEDSILIQTPVYPPFYSAIENHNRKIVQ